MNASRLLLALSLLGIGAASAQPYPSKTIRIVVAYPAGGPIDMVTRPLAQKLHEAMNNPVVVDNRAGANGIVGTDNVAKSPPDGYSLVVASGGSFSINPNVYARMPFDVVKDFAPVSLFITMPELLAVHPTLPVKSVKELVALAKARPGQLNFGSSGTGSTPQLAAELLSMSAGIKMTHVPYKGMGPATMDLIGGQVQLAFADLPVFLPQVKAGKLRALAVGTLKRSANLPDVPTVAESGFPRFEAKNWYALFAPAATPREIVARLNAETVKVLSNPDTKAFMQAQGGEAAPSTPEELGALLRTELAKWGRVVKATGIKLD
ncbi:MAG TPA: tripartite tricarboxylate transporter substrate binding protein [Burkholderiales bacterium]|nr:tripartite tricarboxylate transporter substrate binding protein [Burkholderiales bacterium]